MIFYTGLIDTIVEQTYQHLTTALIYKGTQPDVDTYIERLNSGVYARTGNFLLHSYKNLVLDYARVNQIVQLSLSPSSSESVYENSAGFAEWAVLFHADNVGSGKLLDFDGTGPVFNRTITEDDYFMIVPVSSNTGVGVIKFANIEFTSGQKNLETFNMNVSMIG